MTSSNLRACLRACVHPSYFISSYLYLFMHKPQKKIRRAYRKEEEEEEEEELEEEEVVVESIDGPHEAYLLISSEIC